MRTDLFDFELPESAIALRPANPRDAARMLVVDPSAGLSDRGVRNLPEILRPGDALVFNDTRVIPAALEGRRLRGETAATVSFNLVKRTGQNTWDAFARPAKRLQAGDRVRFGGDTSSCLLSTLEATVSAKGDGGSVSLDFDITGPDLDAAIAQQNTNASAIALNRLDITGNT